MCICLVAICRFCFKKRRTGTNRNYITHPYPINQRPNIRTNNTGAYEPIIGQSYPRPVSIVASTSNNYTSNSDVNKICKRFILKF